MRVSVLNIEVLISDRSALWGAHIRQVNTMKCSYQTGQHYEVLISDRSALGSETGMRTQNGIMCGAYSFSGTTVLEWSVVWSLSAIIGLIRVV